MRCGLLTVMCGLACLLAMSACADDSANSTSAGNAQQGWTQFRGPNRANRSTETSLLTEWPEEGPKLAWKVTGVGEGFSTVSLSDGEIYTMGNLDDQEQLVVLSEESGEHLWKVPFGDAYHQGRGDGPRGTPTIDGDFVYVLGGAGNLACISRKSHKVVWQRNILEDYGARNIRWGISESVLIDGDRLICTPGGSDATIVALDKRTGDEIWKCLVKGEDRAGYASAVAVNIAGVPQYIQFTSKGTIGVRAADGEFLWRNNRSANGTANCSSPLVSGEYVFTASGYGTGGALVKVIPDGDSVTGEFVYHTGSMKNQHGGMVIVDGHVFGSNNGIWTCIDLLSGEVKWKKRSIGKGAVVYADGHIYLRGENGTVALIEANTNDYVERGQFKQPDRSSYRAWPHPVIAGGKLYLRDMDVLLCYDVRKK